MKKRFILSGTAMFIAAIAVVTGALSGGGAAQAGITPCNSTATPVPTASAVLAGVISQLSVAIPTCTPVTKVSTATPKASVTSVATNTPVPVATTAPATVAPVNTAVPATATSPAGGQLGAVSGPNTGTGDGTAAGGFPWVVLAAMAFAAAGIGSLGYGVRKRS